MDHALRDGTVVSAHYDSMLGKLIAHGSTRDDAIDRLAAALEQTVVLGLPTNRAFLIECLRAETFRAGHALIPFLAEEGDTLRAQLEEHESTLQTQMFAALWCASTSGKSSGLRAHFPRPMRMRLRDKVLDARLAETAHGLKLSMDGRDTIIHAHITGDASATLTVAGRQHHARWTRSTTGDASRHVQIDGTDAFITDASYEPTSTGHGNAATQLKAPFNGRVAALHASVGQTVAAGQTLLIIESMKLEHAIAAPRAAVIVSIAVEAGQQVSSQQLLMGFE